MKRGKPLRRKTAIRRWTRIRPRRAKPRRGRIEDPDYLAWLRRQPCQVPAALGAAAGPCGGRIDPEHKREGVGGGRKADDKDAWSCCRRHHRQRHRKNAADSAFRHMSPEQLNAFIVERIAEARARYLSHGSRRAA